jgi:hypothetical protein
MKHTCKAPNCTNQIPDSLLMCPRHWAQVPRSIQIRVTGTWRAMGRGVNEHNHAAYLEARAAAIASLVKKSSDPVGTRCARSAQDTNRTDSTRVPNMQPSLTPSEGERAGVRGSSL